ncbi:0c0540e8-222f-4197-9216-b86414755ce2 [Sclerotinia trifoliorum]|uniref:0c0540e8-222f-4197-9216-b86414755ce2 n=1 Tax=Sclerotinia trifoliorum TaxID=28548 RepID=A0A8H2VTN1_9HELO|nr:0c0540e8-222f-4197-9216-b86414755ce2 [Sclerotinia trifoliorum]
MSRYDGGYETGYESDTSRLHRGRERRSEKTRGPPPSARGFEQVNRLVAESSRKSSDSASRAGTDRSDRSGGTDRTARPRERAPSEGGPSGPRAGSVSRTHGRGSLFDEDRQRRKLEAERNKNIVVRVPRDRVSGAPSNYGGESAFSRMSDTKSHHSNNTIMSSSRGRESSGYGNMDDERSHHSSNTITPSRYGGESRHGGEGRHGGMDDTRSRHSNGTITPSTHRRTPSVAAASRVSSQRPRRDDVEMLSDRARNMQLNEPEDPTDEEARRRRIRGIEKWKEQQELDLNGIEKPVKPGASSVISGASSLVRPGESVDGRDARMERLSAASRNRSVYSGAEPSNYSRESRDRRLAVPSYPGSSSSSRRSARRHGYDDYEGYDDMGYAPPESPGNIVIVNNTTMTNQNSSSSYRR